MTSPQPKITVYWLNESRADRIVWLLEELGLKYDLKLFSRTKEQLAPPEIEELHPLGKVPLVQIEQEGKEPICLVESGFIMQYLTDHFAPAAKPSLIPKKWKEGQENTVGGETEQWMKYQHLMYYVEGSFMPSIVTGIILSMLKSPQVPFFIRPITGFVANQILDGFLVPQMDKHFDFLDSLLATSGGKYLVGDEVTTVDILLSFPLGQQAMRNRLREEIAAGKKGQGIWERHPKLLNYFERIEKLEGFKRAEAKIKEAEASQKK
ncbi:hypothetical protein QBC35DRAFT_500523 [Podospora australis]|uniref:Glutathione S-transferase n=1 Tax=Podospora australis TaxID=1536484 RepID=A0AAN6WRF0_9PEZI|nr:hypothetical protein QBC35DRAFT_500523 [Podospora australis]